MTSESERAPTPAELGGGKPWYRSRGVWGGVIAAAAGVVEPLGLTVSADDQARLAEAMAQLFTVGGALLAIYGRVVATGRIQRKRVA